VLYYQLNSESFTLHLTCAPHDSQTPLAIWDDIKSGRISTLKEVLKTWTKTPLWHPPKSDQALQQGGVVIFEGNEPTWVHRDPSTGAHADMEEVIRVATRGL